MLTRSEAEALYARFSAEGWNFIVYPYPMDIGAAKIYHASVAYRGHEVIVSVDYRKGRDSLRPLLIEILEREYR